jgi:hypothetical protein
MVKKDAVSKDFSKQVLGYGLTTAESHIDAQHYGTAFSLSVSGDQSEHWSPKIGVAAASVGVFAPRTCCSRIVPNRKRRCYQRRSGAPTRGTGPLRLALAGATRSGSAGVGSLSRDPLARLRRIQVESTTINFRPAAITNRDIAGQRGMVGLARVCNTQSRVGPQVRRDSPIAAPNWISHQRANHGACARRDRTGDTSRPSSRADRAIPESPLQSASPERPATRLQSRRAPDRRPLRCRLDTHQIISCYVCCSSAITTTEPYGLATRVIFNSLDDYQLSKTLAD